MRALEELTLQGLRDLTVFFVKFSEAVIFDPIVPSKKSVCGHPGASSFEED